MRSHMPASRITALLNQTLPELPGLPDGISVWTANSLDDLRRKATSVKRTDAEECFQKALFQTIDILGVRSQRAQEINEPLTSVSRLHESNTYRVYLLTYEQRGVGILKVGIKKLFLTHPRTQQMVEVDPVCVLDFYVDESCQRKGFGKKLFMEMLSKEDVLGAEQLAIDRPSVKFISFLKKHFGLVDTVPQVNNFIVFTKFFENTTVSERGKLLRQGGGGGAAGNHRQDTAAPPPLPPPPSANCSPKNVSPEAALGGGRASGRFFTDNNNGGIGFYPSSFDAEPPHPHPHPHPHPQQLYSGGDHSSAAATATAAAAAVGDGDDDIRAAGSVGLGAGQFRLYQPLPPPPPLSLSPPLAGKRGGWPNAVATPLWTPPPSLLPFTVHHRQDDADGVWGADQGAAEGRFLSRHTHAPCYARSAPPPEEEQQQQQQRQQRVSERGRGAPALVPPLFASQQRQHPQGEGEKYPSWGGSHLDRGNISENCECDGYEAAAVVIPLSPIHPSASESRGGAQAGGGAGHAVEDAEERQTPQRHHQRYAKSRVAYNIITGEGF